MLWGQLVCRRLLGDRTSTSTSVHGRYIWFSVLRQSSIVIIETDASKWKRFDANEMQILLKISIEDIHLSVDRLSRVGAGIHSMGLCVEMSGDFVERLVHKVVKTMSTKSQQRIKEFFVKCSSSKKIALICRLSIYFIQDWKQSNRRPEARLCESAPGRAKGNS